MRDNLADNPALPAAWGSNSGVITDPDKGRPADKDSMEHGLPKCSVSKTKQSSSGSIVTRWEAEIVHWSLFLDAVIDT